MLRNHLVVGALLLSGLLSACGLQAGTTPTPISSGPTIPPTTSVPVATSIPAPTQAATTTSVPAATSAPVPTGAPAATSRPVEQPTFAFEPNNGGAGTSVSLRGWGFTPGAPVVIRLGLPHPTGEVLTSAFADNAGRWTATLVMPGALPSGDPITRSDIKLVVMNEQNQALASAPFSFAVANGPTLADASTTVVDLLNQFSTGNVTHFLAPKLRAEVTAGRPVHQVLGLPPLSWQSFTVGAPEDRPSEVLFVPARLVYPTFIDERVFEMVVENGQWRVHGVSLRQTIPTDGGQTPPDQSNWPGPEWQSLASEDYNNDGIAEVLYIKPSSVVPQATFADDYLNSKAQVIDGLLIAQSAAHGPSMLLSVDSRSIIASSQPLVTYDAATGGPAAFLLALDPGSSTLINLLPLKADGTAYGPPVGINPGPDLVYGIAAQP